MKKQELVLGIFLIGLLFTTGCSLTGETTRDFECPDCVCPKYEEKTCPECKECPDDKALLNVELVIWGVNELNRKEILFDYYVYNYGYEEAKNVKVECRAKDSTGKILKTVTENVGNIASTSAVFREIITSNPGLNLYRDKGEIGLCYVTSCDNCEILHKRIPELIEQLK